MEKNKPNLFIVGAPRCGTTSLYEYLKSISGIFMSPVKEPGYFIPNDPRGFSEEEYYSLFDDVVNEKIIGEASAGYLASKETPKIIKKLFPKAKIIITLRDPCERAFSHYLNRLRTGDVSDSLDFLVKKFSESKNEPTISRFIEVGRYHNNVKRYLEIFGKDNIKILIFEETIKNPKRTVESILKFLDLDSKIEDHIFEQHNAYAPALSVSSKFLLENKITNNLGKLFLTKEKRHSILRKVSRKQQKKPNMSEYSKSILAEYFIDDIKNLEKLLNRDLPWETSKMRK